MKIAMPVEDKNRTSTICISFGRAPFFFIYNTDTKESTFLDNSAVASQGGAGIKAAQALVDEGVGALITPRCGENAAAVLKIANIQIYKAINDSVKDNMEAYLDGALTLLNEIHAGFHHHGGSAK